MVGSIRGQYAGTSADHAILRQLAAINAPSNYQKQSGAQRYQQPGQVRRADTLPNPLGRAHTQPTQSRTTAPVSYAAALMASTTGPPNNNGAVVSSGSGAKEKPTGLRPVGLQADTAAEGDAAAAEEDECTEAEILGELSLEVIRRRLTGRLAGYERRRRSSNDKVKRSWRSKL